ncbi:plasma membrane H+-ATPase [Sporothrix epigloea]|uniref:Plasma membrane H+-ATPase n=1 Tax=Sporothrix epigloea TaxID=1892477 RepID=A0ABP0DGU2_9PEZI
MPAPFHFPGHYWDEDKGKFFKIEATGTAPPGAQWSRQEVDAYDRRQQLVDQQQNRRDRRRQRQQQSSPADVSGGGPVVHQQHRQQKQQQQQQQPSKRARRVCGNGNATSSLSQSSSLANVSSSDEKIRRLLQKHADLDERREAVTSRLYDRCPRLGHEVGEGGADSVHCSFSGSRAATAAAVFAKDLEFKGAVPVLDEYEALHDEAVFAADELALRTERTHAVPFAIGRSFPQVLSQTVISCMYVHGEDVNPGAGIVYTNYTRSADIHGVKGQYIPVNDNGDVVFDFALSPRLIDYSPYQRTRPEEMTVLHPTAICFHESSRNLIVCSSTPHARIERPVPTIQFFAPEVSDHTSRKEDVTWQFGCNPPRRFFPDLTAAVVVVSDARLAPPKPLHQLYSNCRSESINACVASPRGYDALCIVATDAGLRAIDIATTESIPLRDMNDSRTSRMDPGFSVVSDFVDTVHPRLLNAGLHAQRHYSYDVLDMKRQKHFDMPHNNRFTVTSVDFIHKHPRLVVAAGRHPVPWLVDLSDRSWHAFGGTSMVNGYDTSIRIDGPGRGEDNAVTHARSAGEYHVVAASLNNKMLMYDLRYMKDPRSSREEDVVAAALFRFRNYHKSSRLTGLGFDVDAELGLVAAAEEHDYYTGLGGGVSLFSLATGERVHAPGLWQFSHSPERLARIYTPTETLLTLPRTTTKEAASSSVLPVTVNTSESDYHDFGLDGPESLQTRSPKPFITVTCGSDRKRYESCATHVATQSLPRVGALSFAALPREGTSLFVAAGARVHKFSLKHDRRDIVYGEDEEDRTKQP